ncbi:hypothetical protein N7490_009610 [Penicillium lividum]|nr:hypothetical protein N7490_009610 [Penicillium lividum]
MGPPNSPASPSRSFPGTPCDPRVFNPVSSNGQYNIDRFNSLDHEEQLNDSIRGLSLLDLQSFNPGIVDAYRVMIVEAMGI